jgi:hypothetical protein
MTFPANHAAVHLSPVQSLTCTNFLAALLSPISAQRPPPPSPYCGVLDVLHAFIAALDLLAGKKE